MNETWPVDQGTRFPPACGLTHRMDLDSHLASLGLSFLICKVEAMTASTSLSGSGNHKSRRMGKPIVTCKAWDGASS